ncbi:SEC12-like protein 2 [Hordeum vulgare]|nr:SEC12-like protein 2 [Hordeum vulgare]
MLGRPRPHLGGRPRANLGRQHVHVRLSTAANLLPPPWQLLDAELDGDGDVLIVRLLRLPLPVLRIAGVAPRQAGPQETPLGRRTRSTGIFINEPDSSSLLVRPKMEPGLLPVKQEHLAMAAADETVLKWTRDDYVREQMERQHHALEELTARRRGRE